LNLVKESDMSMHRLPQPSQLARPSSRGICGASTGTVTVALASRALWAMPLPVATQSPPNSPIEPPEVTVYRSIKIPPTGDWVRINVGLQGNAWRVGGPDSQNRGSGMTDPQRIATTVPAALIRCAIAGVMSLFWLCAADAGVIYSTGFEAPTFTVGGLVAGQDGWTSRFGKPIGTIETDAPSSGQQHLRAAFSDFPQSASAVVDEAFRPILDYDAIANGTPLLRLSVDARLDGPLLTDDVVNAVFEAIPSDIASHGLPFGQLSISANGNLYIYGSRFDDFLVVKGIELGHYYRLGLDLDFAARQTTFLLNDIALATFPFADEIQSTILANAELDALAVNDPTLLSSYTARFDNYSVATVAAPATWSLAVFGLALVAVRLRLRGRAGCSASCPAARWGRAF
jgi:hypothetical protein